MRKYAVWLLAIATSAAAQQAVQVGSGSYAEYTPLSKSNTTGHSGDKSRVMETRHIYMSDAKAGEPIPTNDWWTDLLVDTYSGVLWTYPQVVSAQGDGIYVAHPSHWSSDGCEMKYDTQINVKGRRFHPDCAIADDWSDWGLRMQLADGDKKMNVTMAQGSPFTWVEADNLDLIIDFGGGTADFSTDGRLVVTNGDDIYGVYVPDGTTFTDQGDGSALVEFADGAKKRYVAIAILPTADDADYFADYAPVIVRKTTTSWSYNERSGMMTSVWSLSTENLNGGSNLNALQGFLPHHYKNSENDIKFLDYSYATPRGKMKMAAGQQFSTAYKFSGILPWYAAPKEMAELANPYNRERMVEMITNYANQGSFGSDTYWGGKGLTQMALYMTFAKEMGETALFELCRSRLREALEDWLTYTPGESQRFFARYDHWGALVGYDTSYDSDTFNDHHFHYGYYTYAGALLAMVDDDFRAKYGEMLKLIAKDYANWDRTDKRFPWLRTFSPWSGHSYAGGLGNTGNGNGQESTSEAMQSWGGVYMLGVALGDKEMRDAGIFGWVTESKGTAEYWFDRDKENIDRTLYTHPYCCNLTAAGVGWWTWFSGDPVWMHSIQWMPISPCLDYLSEDKTFAKWDYEQMWEKKEIGGWVTDTSSTESALSKESGLGNVVLSYLQRFDPDQAAQVMDEMWTAGAAVAKTTDTNGISYYITHSHRTYGDRDFSVNADVPTASAYSDAGGNYTYVVYNPDASERTVTFYKDGAAVASFKAPAHKLTAYSAMPEAAAIAITAPTTVEPGTTATLKATVTDQYGATVDDAEVTWTATDGATVDADGTLHAPSSTGTVTVTATSGSLSDNVSVRIDAIPVLTSAAITPAPTYIMSGQTVTFSLEALDQYGDAFGGDCTWTIEHDGKVVKNDSILDLTDIGVYTVKAEMGDNTYTHKIFVTPEMPNLALNKTVTVSSEENTGTLKENAVDGNTSTRWSSVASDDQWICVDLGKEAYVNCVEAVWEAAYATLYDVQTSLDGETWTTVATVNGTGGTEQTSIGATVRYVRLQCKQRATTYGYSLWELRVLGIDPDADPTALMGIAIEAPTTLVKAGEAVQLTAKGYNGEGSSTDTGTVAWTTDKGTVSADGLYTPASYGTATVTATAGGYTATKTFVVEEQIAAASVSISPKLAATVIGEPVQFTLSATDQFTSDYPTTEFTISCAAAPDAVSGCTFTPTAAGNYEIIVSNGAVSDTASVSVGSYAETNLALGKSVYASSYEASGTVPAYAVDGSESTRWGSSFADNQYIVVDLGANYALNRVEIAWNADAYATAYRVEVSADDDSWTTVATNPSSAGGTQNHTFDLIGGRYVRVYCLNRSSIYGSCIDELRVYGTARRNDVTPVSVTPNFTDGYTLFIGKPETLSAVVRDQYGVDCTDEFTVDWSIDDSSLATIDSDDVITPQATGTTMVTASCESVTATRKVRILEECTPTTVTILPSYREIEAGVGASVNVYAYDQYGNQVDNGTVDWTLPDGVTMADGIVTASTAGTYTLKAKVLGIETTATLVALEPLTENIALNKTITASAGADSATSANDGNSGSRWIANDAEETDTVTLTVDLGAVYHVVRSSILWERAAAGDYTIDASVDGNAWTSVNTVEGLNDTEADRTDNANIDGLARYMRLTMTRRATAWAYSIYEWQLYGREMQAGEPCVVTIDALPATIKADQKVALSAKVLDCAGSEINDVALYWSSTGGVVADGKFSSSLEGTFTINCRAQNATASTTATVVYGTSSVAEIVANVSVAVANGSLTVKGDALRSVSIYSASGAMMMHSPAKGSEWHSAVALQHGVYIVAVETVNGMTAKKIVL